jgi:23S rRNA pseudouridine2605 synthase
MRKSSSHEAGKGAGPKNNFRKEGSSKPYNKDAKPFKKNYDGRQAGSEEGASRSSRPYSGRTTDGDQAKRPFAKPFPGKGEDTRRPRSSDGNGAGERHGKSFDKPFAGKGRGEDRPFSDRPKRSFDKPFERKERDSGGRPPRDGDSRSSDRPKRSFDKPFERKGRDNSESRPPRDGERTKRPFDKPFERKERDNKDSRPPRDGERPKRSFDNSGFKNEERTGDRKPRKDEKNKDSFSERSKRLFDREPKKIEGLDDEDKKPVDTRPFRQRQLDKPTFSKDIDDGGENTKYVKPFEGKNRRKSEQTAGSPDPGKKRHFHDITDKDRRRKKNDDDEEEEDEEDKEINQKEGPRLEMPLNKYIAHSGECSRRDAAGLVRQGKVKVNGELVLDPGYRVLHDDKVTMSGKKLTPQKGMVYILLNKPKGFITTNDDPQGRKTVMELVGNAGVDRLFPVGRLDRDTSGLLLITNDGDLTQKLCHPAYNIKKVYHVTLDNPLTKADFEKIVEGVELEDGKAIVDEIAYLEKKNELGLEIHSGRNRIVRRIFESLGYVVEKLDRVMYAGLTKKNLPRSKWRYLDEREVVLLKHFKN